MQAFLDRLSWVSKPLRSRVARYGVIATVAVALLVSCIAVAGCEDEEQTGSNLEPAFLTPVASAQDAGLTVHWLGPSFDAGGILFRTREAKFPEGIAGVPLEGLLARYSSQPEPAGYLDLLLLSRSDWDHVMEKVTNPPILGVTRRAVTVRGTQGELLFLPFGTRPLNILRLVLDLGDVVVVAQAYSVTAPAAEGGGELNPLVKSPDLFVQVMQDLRPYPE